MLSTATDAACALFNEAWADRTPVEWPNLVVDAGAAPLSQGNVPWARVSVLHGGGSQSSLGPEGGRLFEGHGQVVVQVFVPAGKRGLVDADALASAAVSAFRGKTRDGVRFEQVGARTIGNDGPWYQVNVTADYEFDEVA